MDGITKTMAYITFIIALLFFAVCCIQIWNYPHISKRDMRKEKLQLGDKVKCRIPRFKKEFSNGQVTTGEVIYVGLLTVTILYDYTSTSCWGVKRLGEINKFKWNVNKLEGDNDDE